MSAYIVNPENVSDILNHIRLEANNNRFYAPYRWLCDFGYDVCNPQEFKNLYRRLWGMNFRAVYQRYGDHMGWNFSDIIYDCTIRDIDVIQVSDLLRSFVYQCAEGTVYKEDLYLLMDKISEFYKPLASDLEKQKAYEQAQINKAKWETLRKLDKKDVAKLVRARLKAKYPNVKFSVTSGGYSSVTVDWIDGPTKDMVKDLVGMFCGGSYNYDYGYTETKYTIDPETGEEIYCYNDYISFDRSYSVDTLKTVWAILVSDYPGILSIDDIEIKDSGYWNIKNDTPLHGNSYSHYDRAYYAFNQCLAEYSCVVESEKEDESEESNSGVVFGEYKGHATITLPYGDKGFSFGVNKAKAIVEYLAEIQKFIEENS